MIVKLKETFSEKQMHTWTDTTQSFTGRIIEVTSTNLTIDSAQKL